MLTHVRHIEGIVGEAVRHDLLAHLDHELQEALAVVLHSDLPRHILECLTRIQIVPEGFQIHRW